MKDYASMSDREINREVQKLTGMGCMSGAGVLIVADGRWRTFDPCNNPADAWTIIAENKITVHAPMRYDELQEWLAFDVHDSDTDFKDVNPLRAAMIVFLMMKDGE